MEQLNVQTKEQVISMMKKRRVAAQLITWNKEIIEELRLKGFDMVFDFESKKYYIVKEEETVKKNR